MYKQLLPVAICLALLLVPIVYSEEQKPVIRPDIKGLYSEKPLIKQGTYMQLVRQRNNDIKTLIAIVEDKTANRDFFGPLNYAVGLLGEYRAIEAVDALMANLFYVPANFRTSEMLPQERYYVCAVALLNIGSPCLEKIFFRMPKAEQKERQLLAWIVMKILGKEEAIAVLEVQKVKAGKDEPAVAAFVEAIKHIKEWKPVFEPPAEAKIPPASDGDNP